MLIDIGSQVNSELSSLIAASGSFFPGSAWQQHLQKGLGVQSLYFNDPQARDGMVVQVFQRGPFRVGYLNFPVGGTICRANPTMQMIDALRENLRKYSVHRLRVRQSAFQGHDELTGSPVLEPETAVTDVQHYSGQKIPKVRRDLNRAERFGITIAKNPVVSANYLFNTYVETINRYSGELRYPKEYFVSLVDLTTRHHDVRIFIAEKEQQPVGFLVLILETNTAYYLHGGVSSEARKYGVSDVLIDRALCTARDREVTLLNLMTSPPDQPSLVKYKEKWGAESRQHKTYDFPINYLWNQALKVVEKMYREIKRKKVGKDQSNKAA